MPLFILLIGAISDIGDWDMVRWPPGDGVESGVPAAEYSSFSDFGVRVGRAALEA